MSGDAGLRPVWGLSGAATGPGPPVRPVLVPGICERVVRHRERRLSWPEASAVTGFVPAASQRGSGPVAHEAQCHCREMSFRPDPPPCVPRPSRWVCRVTGRGKPPRAIQNAPGWGPSTGPRLGGSGLWTGRPLVIRRPWHRPQSCRHWPGTTCCGAHGASAWGLCSRRGGAASGYASEF